MYTFKHHFFAQKESLVTIVFIYGFVHSLPICCWSFINFCRSFTCFEASSTRLCNSWNIRTLPIFWVFAVCESVNSVKLNLVLKFLLVLLCRIYSILHVSLYTPFLSYIGILGSSVLLFIMLFNLLLFLIFFLSILLNILVSCLIKFQCMWEADSKLWVARKSAGYTFQEPKALLKML